MADLDTILSGEGADAPAPEKIETLAPEAAPKEVQQGTEPQDDVVDHTDGRKLVPLEALTESRGKVKRYTEEVSEFRKSNEALQRQVTELLQRVPIPKPEPVEKSPQPDFYENPEAATDYRARQVIDPVVSQIREAQYFNARLIADSVHEKAKVDEAVAAFDKAKAEGKLDPQDFQRVMSSPNPFHESVSWFKKHSLLTEIGDDAAAYEAKLEAKILAKHGLTPQAEGGKPAAQQTAPVMPSNLATARNVGARSGPAWSGPTPLGDIFQRK